MARKRKTKAGKKGRGGVKSVLRRVRKWVLRGVAGVLVLAVVVIAAGAVLNPITTLYMWQEGRRLGGVDYDWVRYEEIAPVMGRSAVAAEDANYCLHWGLDVDAIQLALSEGSVRGASTISQQVVKNVYLWHGRSWGRKALEALITPAVEALWSKQRILEVYLNVAEFDEGVFGVRAAAWHYFDVGPGDLSAVQAARLAAVLPAPKDRSAKTPSPWLRERAASIMDGAATIKADGRSACFES